MKIFRLILKIVVAIAILLGVTLLAIIIIAMVLDYKPKEKEVDFETDKPAVISDSTEINLMTWNIGYCGLNKEMDFFYDGGKNTYTTKEQTVKNLQGVLNYLKQNTKIDFLLIQEIDRASRRSYYINEFDSVTKELPNFSPFFGKNYDVFFVPLPFTSPMGAVSSGLAIYTPNLPSSSTRFSFPGEYDFPKQLFMLDRCFLVNRYPVSNGKELIVINTHNEAYDAGTIRKTQMEYLKKFLLDEYQKGNFVIVGGDWNQCPPNFVPALEKNQFDTIMKMDIPPDYLPSDWKWMFDNKTPSNRRVAKPYDEKTTLTTVIDFFLLSPNVEGISVKGVHLDFEFSDHNPVITTVKLKK